MPQLFYLWLCLSAIVWHAEASYRLEIRVHSYSNPTNEDYDGGCCDPFCGACDPLYYFCLRDYIQTPSTGDLPCSLIVVSNPTEASYVGSVPNPLVFTSSSAWRGQFQLMVRVDDDDSDHFNTNDLLDRVVFSPVLLVSNTFSSTISILGFYEIVTMVFSSRVFCQANYYGSDCSTFCEEKDSDTLGHYTCGSDGNRVCRDGYTGSSCLTAVCASGCAQGTCSLPGLCDICDQGWSGPNCGQCELAAGCHAERAYCREPGQCICNIGYGGILCQIDNDVCGHQFPCQNGGTCTNNGQDYSCRCPAGGFTGENCEVEVDPCDLIPCQNGATCQAESGSFTCSCMLGWTGTTCDVNIDECSLMSPCQNGGTCSDCVPDNAVVVQPVVSTLPPPLCPIGYTCNCSAGFFGDNCETDIDYCASSPCTNGGQCHDVEGAPGYSCTCPRGYTGSQCGESINECLEEELCQNGGTCTDLTGSFSCSCPPGYNGSLCEIDIDNCLSSPCYAPSTHSCQDRVDGFNCVCIPGYTGADCSADIDECEASPCHNGGTCTTTAAVINDFNCTCPRGFSGQTCSIDIDDCHPDLCLFGGTCVDEVDGYSCTCRPGYSGLQCETKVDICTTSSCGPGMFCVELASGFECLCVEGAEAGCETGGANATNQGNTRAKNIIGGVTGGVITALIVLIALLVLICCWWCCCCRQSTKEGIDEFDTEDHSQNNPLYFGASTILSSGSGTAQSTTNFGPAPVSRPPVSRPGPDLQQEHAYTDLSQNTAVLVGYNTFESRDEPHYERIPGQLMEDREGGGGGVISSSSGHYDNIKEPPPPPCCKDMALKSGQYDKLDNPATTEENPYVMEPDAHKARRAMYSFLPSSEELKKMANANTTKYT